MWRRDTQPGPDLRGESARRPAAGRSGFGSAAAGTDGRRSAASWARGAGGSVSGVRDGSAVGPAAVGHRPIIPAGPEFSFTASASRCGPAQGARVAHARGGELPGGREHQAVLPQAVRDREPERQERPREVVGAPDRLESRR